ncbi:hypothetical protein AYI70_g3635 [Smittium culicis]|uniref:CCHC-type domain-containing protein n=1 Tax=Smittium culicis TaxID=133412 RepID=A0A1R1Y329_9FUNG|nr:hypothetical protein AYI70_g3635 [Smittium culicis]
MSAKVLEPKIFYGKEGEDSPRWMKRYECFRKACKWTDSEAVDYLDLFLEGRSLNWYKGFTILNKDWDTVKCKFLDVFTDEDEEITSWNELINFNTTGKDSIEIAGVLTHLFSKAKITSEPEKLKYLMKSLDPNKRRKILEAGADSFEKALETLSREEKYEKLIGEHDLVINSDKKVIKEMDTMNTLIKRFDDLSLNLINRDREIEKIIRGPIEKPRYRSYSNYKCFNCNQYGHRIDQCQVHKTDERHKKDSNLRGETVGNVPKEVNCVELELDETEIFASEKRPHIEDIDLTKKKTRVLDDVVEPNPLTKDRPIIQSRKPAMIKLSTTTVPYSISRDLANAKADLSYSQLLQVAPSIRSELIGLCRKQESKELNNVEFADTMGTNCRGLVKIFNDRHWAVLDTGAACSVISSSFMESLGLEINNISDQTIITADGSKHHTLGIVSDLPITIANYVFPCDTLVLDLKKSLMILGTDWFTKYNAVLDLKAKELVLERPEVDLVMKLYTSKPNRRVRDEFEVFGIGIIDEEMVKEEKTPMKVRNSLNKIDALFVSELSQLTQTDTTEHSIDTGDSQPY